MILILILKSHYLALKDTIYKQNGKINYETQKTWFPHEVLSLGHWYCESKAFEVAYAVCNCILARNILMYNNIFDDFRDYEIERMSSNDLTEIINYHIHYTSRLNLLEHSPYRNWASNNF